MAITSEILELSLAGDLAALKAVPKTDLHAHLVLSAPFDTYRHISEGKIEAPPQRFRDLEHFLKYVREKFFPLLNSLEVYQQITRDCFEHMIADGIVYTEVSFDLMMPILVGCSWDELLTVLKPEIERVSQQLKVCPELGLARDFPGDEWHAHVEEALATSFFKSIDLYGSETLKPISDFESYCNLARSKGLKIKTHSGETGSPERLLQELRTVKPAAIQHGVRAAENDQVLRELAQSRAEVNVCPWSNYCLRVVDQYQKHPIRKMFDFGVNVTINSDDYAVFGKSVSEEYLMLYQHGVFSADQLENIRQHGLKAMQA